MTATCFHKLYGVPLFPFPKPVYARSLQSHITRCVFIIVKMLSWWNRHQASIVRVINPIRIELRHCNPPVARKFLPILVVESSKL